MSDEERPIVEPGPIGDLVARLRSPQGLMTAQFEGERAGVLIRSVQVCADDPVLISLVVPRGHSIDPLIRDSHAFAVCLLGEQNKLIKRKFAETQKPEGALDSDEPRDDPFDAFRVCELATGSPILDRVPAVLDCEVVRHFDLEADHEIYVGHVVAARIYDEAALETLGIGRAKLEPTGANGLSAEQG